MPNPVPFRLAVLKALTQALREITPSNGYVTDISDNVFRGRAIYSDSDPLPLVSILEDPVNEDEYQGDLGSTTTGPTEWALLIQGFVLDDPENPTDPAYNLLADVKKRIIQERARDRDILGFGPKKPCVTDIVMSSGIVRPPDNEISDKAYFWLNVTLTLIEDHNNPFT